MQNKTVLITGSTSGIGLQIAIEFAKQGFNICFHGLEPNGNEIAKDIATQYGVQYIYSNANALNTADLQQMVANALQKFGTIQVLINNAGIQYVSPLENFPIQKWNDILTINLTAPFILCQALWPNMQANKYGRVINIASVHGLVASPNKSAYVAAKHGLVGFTKTIALEGATYNITANTICPGYVYTPIIEKQIPEQMQIHKLSKEQVINDVLLSKHAIKEFIPVDAIAQMCLYLCSNAANYITGTSIPIDAGWTTP
jgi:3-hydroxybutyrate dehydrogenase